MVSRMGWMNVDVARVPFRKLALNREKLLSWLFGHGSNRAVQSARDSVLFPYFAATASHKTLTDSWKAHLQHGGRSFRKSGGAGQHRRQSDLSQRRVVRNASWAEQNLVEGTWWKRFNFRLFHSGHQNYREGSSYHRQCTELHPRCLTLYLKLL